MIAQPLQRRCYRNSQRVCLRRCMRVFALRSRRLGDEVWRHPRRRGMDIRRSRVGCRFWRSSNSGYRETLRAMDQTQRESHLGWFPGKPLSGKRNFKSTFRIAEDGSVTQRVRLQVDDKFVREEIICKHFLSYYVRWVVRDRVGVTFTSRDDPWDFGMVFSNGLDCFLEITAIAEAEQQFVERSREEKFAAVRHQQIIPVGLLRKLYRHWPSEDASALLATAEKLDNRTKVLNPWFGQVGPIWVSRVGNPELSLLELIRAAVLSKAVKRHAGKGRTILVIDNRTAFELGDYHEASRRFDELSEISPFFEVYLYTGYYSDDDGSNAEWSFAPILVTTQTAERIQLTLAERLEQPNAAGLVFGGFEEQRCGAESKPCAIEGDS